MHPLRDAELPAIPARFPAYLVSGIGLLYIVLWIWYGHAFNYTMATNSVLPESLVFVLKVLETSVLVGMSGALVYAGYWFATGQYSPQQQLWGVMWTIIGSTGIIAVVIVLNAHQMTEGLAITPQLLAEEILLGGAGGGFAGLLIGVGAMESMYKADQVVKQRDAFEFLNNLLRHNLLNGINIIHGTAVRIESAATPEVPEHLSTIKDRSRSIADLAQNVKYMAGTLSGEVDHEPVDLASILRTELDTARTSFPEAEFDASIPEKAVVLANPALHGVFDNLLTNAVEHNDAETPRVKVTVDQTESAVRIQIADNGPGIAPKRNESMFEPSDRGDHGMGLYLVKTIVNSFDGEVAVEANEPTGTVFTIVLPRPALGRE